MNLKKKLIKVKNTLLPSVEDVIAESVLTKAFHKYIGKNTTIERFDEVINDMIKKHDVTDPKQAKAYRKKWDVMKKRAIKLNWDDLKKKYK